MERGGRPALHRLGPRRRRRRSGGGSEPRQRGGGRRKPLQRGLRRRLAGLLLGQTAERAAGGRSGQDRGLRARRRRPQHDVSASETAVPDEDAEYQGATPNGSKVYFTAKAGLTAESSAEGTDLYQYDFGAPEGERLTDLSVAGSGPPAAPNSAPASTAPWSRSHSTAPTPTSSPAPDSSPARAAPTPKTKPRAPTRSMTTTQKAKRCASSARSAPATATSAT